MEKNHRAMVRDFVEIKKFAELADGKDFNVETPSEDEISKNNTSLDKVYISKNVDNLTYYKTWADTQKILSNDYQSKTEMNSYYSKTEVNNNFALKSAFDNYSTTKQINEKFNNYSTTEQINERLGISGSDKFKKQTITIDDVTYTVLVLE